MAVGAGLANVVDLASAVDLDVDQLYPRHQPPIIIVDRPTVQCPM